MKKILMISYTNIFPPNWGGASRSYNITKILAKDNKIWLICNDFPFIESVNSNNDEIKELSDNGNVKLYFKKFRGGRSQIFNPKIIKLGLELIKKEKPDIIFAHSLYSAFNSILLHFLTGIPFILDEHNAEFLRHERIYKKRKYHRFILKIFEKFSCRFASKILCVSEIDRDLLSSEFKINKSKIKVIPNAVDTKKFYPSEKNNHEIRKKLKVEDEPLILFFGRGDYTPNYEAIEIIRNKILPVILKKIPKAKFLIVGDNPPLNFQHENIIFTGVVDKIEDYINVSDIVICPLLSGGGTKFKILEALCCGKIVISTTIGAEGILLNEFKDSILISDNWDDFGKKIVSILSTKNPSKVGDFYSLSWGKSVDEIKKLL